MGWEAVGCALTDGRRPVDVPLTMRLVGVALQFIALCEASGASAQAALRGMAAMVCGLRYGEDDRLLPLEGDAA